MPHSPLPYAPASSYEPIFVARQPVFDLKMRVWAYELLFRHSAQASGAHISDPNTATSTVIADGFAIAAAGSGDGIRMLINFPQALLLEGMPLALPKEGCIIEILETVDPTPQIVSVCRKYKKAGYRLAMDDFVGQPGLEPLLELADVIKIDVAALAPPQIIKLAQKLERYSCALLAEKIETSQDYDLTRNLGFRYFQGYYFSRPEMVSGRKISMEGIAKLKLLQELSREDYRISDLAKIVSMDVSLSYRLLTYLNSAAFALRHRVQSLPQAIAILGENPLRQWLAAVILADFDRSPRAEEMVLTSMRRGRFLELITSHADCSPYRPETFFLLGLFSKLDALLGMEMEEIIKNMPLDEGLHAALCGRENLLHHWLALARDIDRGNWSRVGARLAEFRLPPARVAREHQAATTWAHNLLASAAAQ